MLNKYKYDCYKYMIETNQPISRGSLYINTHMRAGGTYINEDAQIIGVSE